MGWTGNKIKILRKRLGWSSSQLARRLGCNADLMAKIEKELVDLDAETIGQLTFLSNQLEEYSEKVNRSPMADKLMVAVALVLLVELHASPWFAVPACIIICREILVSALREWMADLGKRTSVAVSYVGKVKTAFQMISISILLAVGENLLLELAYLGYFLLYAAALLTLWSMFIYLKAAAPDLRLQK